MADYLLPKVSKFRNYTLTATAEQRARLAAAIAMCIMLIAFLVPLSLIDSDLSTLAHWLVAVVSLIVYLMIGLLFYALMKRPIRAADRKRDQVLGRQPTNDEKVAMYVWYKYGQMPTSKAIQPLLPKYLDYLEMRLNGSYSDDYTTSKRYRYFILITAIFWLVSGVTNIYNGNKPVFIIICDFIAGLGSLANYFVLRTAKPRKLSIKLNSKRLAKIAAMRQQLAAAQPVSPAR